MKSNQKGFTLIELLAVIVILAIIALIATPIVLNIIDKARISAAEDSVYGTMEAIKLAYTESLMDVNPITLPLTVTCSQADGCYYLITKAGDTTETKVPVNFTGTKPTVGTFTLDVAGYSDTTDIELNNLYCKITAGKVECQKSAF